MAGNDVTAGQEQLLRIFNKISSISSNVSQRSQRFAETCLKMEKELVVNVLKRTKFDHAIEVLLGPLSLTEIYGLDEKSTKDLLKNGRFVDDATVLILDNIKKLKASDNSNWDLQRTNAKYISDGAKFATFGDQDSFLKGLNALIGYPDLHILRAMIREHKDSDRFLTHNYNLWTSPRIEMVSLLGKDDCFTYMYGLASQEESDEIARLVPLKKDISELKSKFDEMADEYKKILEQHGYFPGEVGSKFSETKVRLRIEWDENRNIGDGLLGNLNQHLKRILESHPNCLPELQARLRTRQQDLCFTISNTKAERNLHVEVILPIAEELFSVDEQAWLKAGIEAAITSNQNIIPSSIILEDIISIRTSYTLHGTDGTKKGRVLKSLQKLVDNDDARAAGLRVDEVIAAYMYTGPMYQKWNSSLRDAAKESGSTNATCDSSLYATSIHTLVSAISKLAMTAAVPMSRKVYRGLGSITLHNSFFKPDRRNTRGGVEFSFLSTTLDRKVALQYSGGGSRRGIVLEIGVGKIDSGAKLQSISQYESENEILFPPLSNLEVVGEPWVEPAEEGQILVVPVKVNANFKAQTIQQIIESRKLQVMDLARRCSAEVESQLRKLEERGGNHQESAEALRRKIDKQKEEMQDYRSLLECKSPEWFNHDNNLKDCWNKLLHMKNTSMASCFGHKWMDDLLAIEKPSDFMSGLSRLRERYTHEIISEVAKAHLDCRNPDSGNADDHVELKTMEENPPAIGNANWFDLLASALGQNWLLNSKSDTAVDSKENSPTAARSPSAANTASQAWDDSLEVIGNVWNHVMPFTKSVSDNVPFLGESCDDLQPLARLHYRLLLASTTDFPMSVCAIQGDVHGVRLWLAAGMDKPEKITAQEPTYNNSALHWACYYGHEKVVEELLEAKADPNQRNKVLQRIQNHLLPPGVVSANGRWP